MYCCNVINNCSRVKYKLPFLLIKHGNKIYLHCKNIRNLIVDLQHEAENIHERLADT